MSENKVYNNAVWKAVRLQCLERDKWICQIKGPKCTVKGTEADHIIAFRDGGAEYELSNLQASCKPCNSSKAIRNKNENGWQRSDTEIVLYLKCADIDHDDLDGMVMDDRLHGIIGETGWQAMVKALRRGELTVPIVHIFSDHPDAKELYPYTKVISGEKTEVFNEDGSVSLKNWTEGTKIGGLNGGFESSRW